jgi:hypothetical protein
MKRFKIKEESAFEFSLKNLSKSPVGYSTSRERIESSDIIKNDKLFLKRKNKLDISEGDEVIFFIEDRGLKTSKKLDVSVAYKAAKYDDYSLVLNRIDNVVDELPY